MDKTTIVLKYDTRLSTSEAFTLPRINAKICQMHILFTGPKFYSFLPKNIKNVVNLKTFYVETKSSICNNYWELNEVLSQRFK